MSRIDTISRALDAHLFINLHNRPDDETLRDQFDSLSPEAQQQLVDLATPKPSHPEALDPEILSDAALVARRYAFRMVGSEQLPPFLRRAILLADGVVGDDEEEPDLDSPDLLNEAQRQLWEALPKNFIKKEAIQIAMENGIQLRTTAKYLDLYLALGLLRRTSRGCYSKK